MKPVGAFLKLHWIAWCYRAFFARLSGHREIIKANLARVYPDRSEAERARLLRRIIARQGRFYGEALTIEKLLPGLPEPEIDGPGREAFFAAVAAERPVILVTGHIGNYVMGLHVMTTQGLNAGFLYRTRGNALLDSSFDEMLGRLGQRGFKISHRSHHGYEGNLKDFIEFLSEGHVVVMLADHRDRSGMKLAFLGHRAPTSLTPAKLALAHDALLVPCFVLRAGRGSRFRVRLEAPIAPSKPGAMMKRFNDLVSELILSDPAQWSWTIRRW